MVAAQYFPVVADFKSVIGQSVRGTVTFTPVLRSGDVILATTLDPRPASLVPQQVSGRIDADGRLKLRTKPDGVRQDAANLAGFPATGIASKYYVAGDTGKFYRWNGTSYYEILPYEPVRLLADTELLELDSPLFYQVTFSGITVGDTRVPTKVTPFTFAAPNSSSVTVNLAEVGRQPGQPPGGITKIAPTAVRLVDDAKIQFSFDNQDIPDALDLNLQIGPNDVETLPDGRLQFKWNGNNIGDPVLLQLPSPTVFAARDYGVTSDGLAANNAANLLDCVAQCVEAGGGVVRLDAGTTYVDAVLGATLTADSGRTYTNYGAAVTIPPGVNIAFEGNEAEGLSILKLSKGVLRAFDFAPATSGAQYKNVVIRNLTIDRSHIAGTDLAPLSTITGSVSVSGFTWATIPGLTVSQWQNCKFAFSPTRKLTYQVRISGSNVQFSNNGGTGITFTNGDTAQGCLYDSAIGTQMWNHTYPERFQDFTIDSFLVENVVSKLSPSIVPAPVALANVNGDTSGHIAISIRVTGSEALLFPSIRVRNCTMTGGNVAVSLWDLTALTTANAASNTIAYYDNVEIDGVNFDTLLAPCGNWASAGVMVGGRSNRVRITNCRFKNVGDVGTEVDNCWDFIESGNTYDDCVNAVFRTNFLIPAPKPAGPTKTQLTLGSTLSNSATSATIAALPPDVERAGLALVDTEVVAYRCTSGDGLTLQLWRAAFGTAATHAANATVTFLPLRGQRYVSRDTRIVKKDSVPFYGVGWYSFSSNNIPMPPIQIYGGKVEYSGTNTAGSPSVIVSKGLCFDTSVHGLRVTMNGFTLASGSFAPAAVVFGELTSSTKVRDLYTSGVPLPTPRLHVRDTILGMSGAAANGVIAGISISDGWLKLDTEVEVEAAHANTSGRAYGVQIGNSGSNLVIAPGSKVNVKMRNVLDASTQAGSSQWPIALSTGSGANLVMPAGLDVEIDASEMQFGTGANDAAYLPYWIGKAADVGLVRVNRIIHSSMAGIPWAARKMPTKYVTGPATYNVTSFDEVLLVDTTSGAVTINLPKVVGGLTTYLGEPLMQGRPPLRIIDAKRTANTNNITITPNAADKIDALSAGSSLVLNTAAAARNLFAQPALPGWVSA